MTEKPINERVSILETRVDQHDNLVQQHHDSLMTFFGKLDEHIVTENAHDAKMEGALIQVTTVVESLTTEIAKTNIQLDKFSTMASNTNLIVTKAESAWVTIVKVMSILSLLVAAGWAVYDLKMDHPEAIQILKGK